MRVMIDIPEEFERDLQDKFNEFFERMIADIDYALDKQEPLLCGNYERETAEMFLSAFEKATVIPDDAEDKSISLKKVKKAREEIDDLDRHFDNDYFSSNNDSMFKCNEVLAILDGLIAESEGKEKDENRSN